MYCNTGFQSANDLKSMWAGLSALCSTLYKIQTGTPSNFELGPREKSSNYEESKPHEALGW
jgi:hypothetical protein